MRGLGQGGKGEEGRQWDCDDVVVVVVVLVVALRRTKGRKRNQKEL